MKDVIGYETVPLKVTLHFPDGKQGWWRYFHWL
jgi:hypothetical protein